MVFEPGGDPSRSDLQDDVGTGLAHVCQTTLYGPQGISPRGHRVLFVSRGPKGSMIVPIIEFSQESENVSLAKIIPSGDKKKCL